MLLEFVTSFIYKWRMNEWSDATFHEAPRSWCETIRGSMLRRTLNHVYWSSRISAGGSCGSEAVIIGTPVTCNGYNSKSAKIWNIWNKHKALDIKVFINFHLPPTKLSHLHFTRYFELPPLMGPWEQHYFRKFIFPSTLFTTCPLRWPRSVSWQKSWHYKTTESSIGLGPGTNPLTDTHEGDHGILTSQLFLINVLIFPSFCPQFPPTTPH